MNSKPRLVKSARGWSCIGFGREGNSKTPRGAYMDWLNECSFYPYV